LEIGEYTTCKSHESPKNHWGEAEMNWESFKKNCIGKFYWTPLARVEKCL